MNSKAEEIEDLVEFYRQWPELRSQIFDLIAENKLTMTQKKVIRSMIHVVDCVGPADLKSD